MLPNLFISLDLVWEVFEEAVYLISKSMPRKCQYVEPNLLLHPVELLVSIVDTSSSFKEHASITSVQSTTLHEDFEADHKFEGRLISFEETTIFISVHSQSHALNDVLHAVLYKLSFWTIVDTVVEQI